MREIHVLILYLNLPVSWTSNKTEFKALIVSAGLLVPWVVFSLVWSVGSTCDNDGRSIFSNWLRNVMIKENHEPLFPTAGLVYDYK